MLSGGGDFGPASLREHIERFGPPPSLGRGRSDRAAFVDVVERSGLRGRGGGGFPTGVKLRAVAGGRRRPVVVANGAEGEPLSAKDKVVLTTSPHLVLDGAVLAASALRAADVIVVVDRTARDVARRGGECHRGATRHSAGPGADPNSRLAHVVSRRRGERPRALAQRRAGEADARPAAVRSNAGVGGRPTLVQNVETLAPMPAPSPASATLGSGASDHGRSRVRLSSPSVAPSPMGGGARDQPGYAG